MKQVPKRLANSFNGEAMDGLARQVAQPFAGSIPRAVALEQLPSPGASSLEGVIWYTDLPEVSTSQRGLVHCGRHPNNSMPMTGVLMACTRGLGRPILVVALGFYSPRVMPGVSRLNSQHE